MVEIKYNNADEWFLPVGDLAKEVSFGFRSVSEMLAHNFLPENLKTWAENFVDPNESRSENVTDYDKYMDEKLEVFEQSGRAASLDLVIWKIYRYYESSPREIIRPESSRIEDFVESLENPYELFQSIMKVARAEIMHAKETKDSADLKVAETWFVTARDYFYYPSVHDEDLNLYRFYEDISEDFTALRRQKSE